MLNVGKERRSVLWAAVRVWAADVRDRDVPSRPAADLLIRVLDSYDQRRHVPTLEPSLWTTVLLQSQVLRAQTAISCPQ